MRYANNPTGGYGIIRRLRSDLYTRSQIKKFIEFIYSPKALTDAAMPIPCHCVEGHTCLPCWLKQKREWADKHFRKGTHNKGLYLPRPGHP